jgi:hypothetical protein
LDQAVKVTVCEFPDEQEFMERAWAALADYLVAVGPSIVILPEMPFCDWIFVGARLLVDSEFRIAGGIVGTGFDEFRWITPVHPGDTLRLEAEVIDVRRSSKLRSLTSEGQRESQRKVWSRSGSRRSIKIVNPCKSCWQISWCQADPRVRSPRNELNKGNTTMPTIEKRNEQQNQELTQQEAVAILTHYQELWNRGALPELLDGFTDDITVDFADLPTIRGKRELDRIIQARLARQKHYHLKKTLRFVSGNTIVGSWVADWTDGLTGRPMKGKGIEFIEIREGKCARWEASSTPGTPGHRATRNSLKSCSEPGGRGGVSGVANVCVRNRCGADIGQRLSIRGRVVRAPATSNDQSIEWIVDQGFGHQFARRRAGHQPSLVSHHPQPIGGWNGFSRASSNAVSGPAASKELGPREDQNGDVAWHVTREICHFGRRLSPVAYGRQSRGEPQRERVPAGRCLRPLSQRHPARLHRPARGVLVAARRNIGATERLDFTVIGPAVNLVSRLEATAKTLKTPIVLSDDFARAYGKPLISIGHYPFGGLAKPRELFVPVIGSQPARASS